jgi:colanic acid biosynthesis glycosyl transferase WcaI
MIGIIHPCKIYGAMAVGRPVLFLGPRPSHVSDLLDQHEIGWHVAHGDVEAMVRAIEQIRQTPAETMTRMGRTARRVLQADMGQAILCGRFCDHLERVFHPRRAPVAPADERNVSCAR